MPRPGRPTTERAKDFKGTLRQIIRTMSHYKLPLAAAMLFAVLSTIFNIAGPKVLAKATTALATTSAARSAKRSTACRWRTLKSAPWARCSPASPTMWTRWDRA